MAKIVQVSFLLAVLSVLFGAEPASADTSPTVAPSVEGIAGTNGWYRGSTSGDFVYFHWGYADPNNVVDHTTGCEPVYRIDGDTTGTTETCTAYLKPYPDGGSVQWQRTIKIDATPPTGLTASPSRGPDANGWYNHAFGLAWSGSDATSRIAGCSSTTYSGPDKGAGTIAGGCTDLAGNNSSTTFSFNYDATPPQLTAASVQSTDGANIVHWKSSSPQDVAAIGRLARGSRSERSLFSGGGVGFVDKKIQAGVEYRYTVRTYDEAGNASAPRTVLALPKVISLGKNGYTPRTAKQPILSWPTRRGASYYHVQLFRDGKRILAAWPLTTQLALHAHWRWAGHRYRLSPGTYAWFAWAGIGPRSAARYKQIGHSTFIVPGR